MCSCRRFTAPLDPNLHVQREIVLWANTRASSFAYLCATTSAYLCVATGMYSADNDLHLQILRTIFKALTGRVDLHHHVHSQSHMNCYK